MLAKQSRPYEILVRFGEDGQVHAHYIELTCIVDTETGQPVTRPEETPAAPVTPANAGAILGEQTATYLERIAALEAEITALRGTAS